MNISGITQILRMKLKRKLSNMQKQNRICFYMPSKVVGGGEFLFARVAKYLSNYRDIEVFYVDYKDGFVRNLLKDTNIKFIDYKKRKNTYKIDDDITVVVPIIYIFDIAKIKNKNVKFLFWNLHVENINWLKYISNLNFNQMKQLIKYLSDSNSLINQDIGPYATAKKYYSDVQKKYIPIMLDNCDYEIRQSLLHNEELNIGYLSRLDEDKIYSLINLLENLKGYKTDKKIKVHIIGDGIFKNKVNVDEYSKYFDIIFVGKIIEKDLQNYMKRNIDIHFAMGTSLLEGERIAIPSIMTFYSPDQFRNNDFVFGHELPEGLVGCGLDFKEASLNKYSLQYVLDKFVDDVENLSMESRKHFEKNFLIDNIIDNIVECCNESTLFQFDIDRIKKKFKYQKFESVINKIFMKAYHKFSSSYKRKNKDLINNPLVSIILPVYNGEKFLSESIESVLNQTYKNLELIIVNDCSIDNSLKIAEKYAAQDSRIKIITNKENQKLPESLNIGFEHAKGKYFSWTSDDNYYHKTAIKRMVEYLENNNDDVMVCCDFDKYEVDTNNKYTCKLKISPQEMILGDCVGACFLYRQSAAQIVGKYNKEKFLVEDYDYWLRMMLFGDIGHIPESLYTYRLHSKSLTGQRFSEIIAKTEEIQKIYYKSYKYKFHVKKKKTIDIINNIFSIKDNGKAIVIKFLGIKISFSRGVKY